MEKNKTPNVLSQYQFTLLAVIAFMTLGVGTVAYHYIEKLSWVDSLYFSTITLTTIGYGDITPQTDAGKLFTVFYVIVGISIVGAFVNAIIRRAYARQQAAKQSRISKLFAHLRHESNDEKHDL